MDQIKRAIKEMGLWDFIGAIQVTIEMETKSSTEEPSNVLLSRVASQLS